MLYLSQKLIISALNHVIIMITIIIIIIVVDDGAEIAISWKQSLKVYKEGNI